jgi:hypothetical protein
MLRQFTNPFDPTDQELRDWAQGQRFALPQDWELVIPCSPKRHSLILELAVDPTRRAKHKRMLLNMLYLITEQFVLSKSSPEQMEKLINSALASRDPDAVLWANRSNAVVREPSKFHRKKWILGARKLGS